MITIVMIGQGGELDRREATTAEDAAIQLVHMIEEAGEVYPGDKFEVTGHEE